jgi:dUTP pyrophosphatase
MTIKFKKLTDKAIQPVRATNSGAGYNLTAVSATTEVNERGQMILVYHTNLSVEIPDGFEGVIRPCNSICAKTLRMCDSPSVISGSMDDEIVVRFVITTDVIPAVYKEGDQIAQLVINKVEDVEFVEFIDTTENKEQSAAEGPQSLPETEGEPTNSETATDASGETTNGLEEAQ